MNKIFKGLKKIDLGDTLVTSGGVFIRQVLGLGLTFIWIFLITNLFGASTYGLVSLTQVIINFCALLFCLGIPTAVIKLGAIEEHFDGKKFRSLFLYRALVMVVASSIICSTILFFYRDFIANQIFNNKELSNYLLVASSLFVLFTLHKTISGFLTVQEKFKKYGNFIYIYPNIIVLFSVFLVYILKLPHFYLIGGFMAAFGVLGIFLISSFVNIPKEVDTIIKYGTILKLSSPMMISGAFLFISTWTDTFMLGMMVDNSDLGVYNATYKLATIALLVLSAVNTVIAPKLSKLFHLNKIEEMRLEVQKATRLITYCTLPIVVVMLVFKTQLLSLFGQEFTRGGMTLVIISIGLLFNALSGSVGNILNMTKHQNALQHFTLISALCNIVLNYFLIGKFGIVGAAIASLVSNVIFNGLGIIHVRRKLGFYTFIQFKI